MLDTRIRAAWDRFMQPVGRVLARTRISPNAITLGGVAIQIGVAAAILEGRLGLAAVLAIVAALSDVLDGAVAKARGLTSNFGALLDSTTDRLSDALFFLPIAWLYAVDPDVARHAEPWVGALSLATLVLSFLVSYVKARAEGLGYECRVGIVERAERVIIMIVGLAFDALPIVLVLLAGLSLITLVQRVAHVYRQARDARG